MKTAVNLDDFILLSSGRVFEQLFFSPQDLYNYVKRLHFKYHQYIKEILAQIFFSRVFVFLLARNRGHVTNLHVYVVG